MGVVISVTNQKGGVGKTVTVSSVAAILHEQGYRVLTINLDPQRNLDMAAGCALSREDSVTPSVLQVLRGECSIREALVESPLGDLLRASSFLSQWTGSRLVDRNEYAALTEKELLRLISERYRAGTGENDAAVLAGALAPVRDDYDFVIMDTNPSLTLLTLNALFAADCVLIPAFTEAASMDAILELWDTIQNIRYYNPEHRLEILGILITRFQARTTIARNFLDIYGNLARQMNTVVFQQTIRQSIAVSEYMMFQENLISYSRSSPAAKDYLAFVEEMKQRLRDLGENVK